VAVIAMSLPGVESGEAGSSPDVLTPGHGFQVGGVDAVTHTAQVVEYEPFRYRTDVQFVGEAMNSLLPSIEPELSISVPSDVTAPSPAIVFITYINVGPEVFLGRGVCHALLGKTLPEPSAMRRNDPPMGRAAASS
jgi:hypothetical protein